MLLSICSYLQMYEMDSETSTVQTLEDSWARIVTKPKPSVARGLLLAAPSVTASGSMRACCDDDTPTAGTITAGGSVGECACAPLNGSIDSTSDNVESWLRSMESRRSLSSADGCGSSTADSSWSLLLPPPAFVLLGLPCTGNGSLLASASAPAARATPEQ